MENDEYDENCELSPELLRLVEQDAREIKPHQEKVEMINLEDDGEEKKVKIGAGLTKEMKLQLYTLLTEFKDICLVIQKYAWFRSRNCTAQATT